LKEYVKIRVIFTVGDCENILPNEIDYQKTLIYLEPIFNLSV
jgi:hypothetical protein